MVLLGLSGYTQSGKSTLAQAIVDHVWGRCARTYSFADTLKQMAQQLFGLTHAQCYGTEADKNTLTKVPWSSLPIMIQPEFRAHSQFLLARELLQLFGSDIVRRMNSAAWVDATLVRIGKDRPDIAVIVDVRFPNEVQGIQRYGGKVIHLLRNPCILDSHASEQALDGYSGFDAILDNRDIGLDEQCETVLDMISFWL
jgi:hypothetical protein